MKSRAETPGMSEQTVCDVNSDPAAPVPSEAAPASEKSTPRRNRKVLGRSALVLAAGTILAAALVYPFSVSGRFGSAIFDLAHAPAFFCMFLLAAGIPDPACVGLKRSSRPLFVMNIERLFVLGMGLFVVGAACEVAQKFSSRHPSIADVAANSIGLLAAGLWCSRRSVTRTWLRCLVTGMAAACLLLPSIWPIIEMREIALQRKDIPVLASFERPGELLAWQAHEAIIQAETSWVTHGRKSLMITAAGEEFPGALMLWPFGDWTGYTRLRLDLYNPEQWELKVGISIADKACLVNGYEAADRFDTHVVVAPESRRTLMIELGKVATAPATRTMVMSEISQLNIFMPHPPKNSRLLIDNVRLVRPRAVARP